MNSAKVYKKTAPNGKVTVYLERRELILEGNWIQPLTGVLYIDPNYVKDRKVFGQFMLTFRYGREDEEVMGLKFCNEACLSSQQLWPKEENEQQNTLTPLQETLVRKLGAGAVPFCYNVSSLAPPSVTLLPARTYNGAPIGTNYDLRVFVGDIPEDKAHKRSSIRMGIKLFQISPNQMPSEPYASSSKQFLLQDGQVALDASLDKEIYDKDEIIKVRVNINNHSKRSVKKIKVFVVQFVDVAMFSNGKFKNVVATLESSEGCPVSSGNRMTKIFELQPRKGSIKNWIALEEFYDKDSTLASSVFKPENTEKNVFAIYVSYYVKVKAMTSVIGGEISVKIPFKIMRKNVTLEEEFRNSHNRSPMFQPIAIPANMPTEMPGIMDKEE